MGPCLALLSTTTFSTGRGEFSEDKPEWRIPALVDGAIRDRNFAEMSFQKP
jgi:hypothetical protein